MGPLKGDCQNRLMNLSQVEREQNYTVCNLSLTCSLFLPSYDLLMTACVDASYVFMNDWPCRYAAQGSPPTTASEAVVSLHCAPVSLTSSSLWPFVWSSVWHPPLDCSTVEKLVWKVICRIFSNLINFTDFLWYYCLIRQFSYLTKLQTYECIFHH